MATDDDWLAHAVRLATENVAAGGGPFAAVVVAADGSLLAEGQNRVTLELDPTAHGEVVAIREACQALEAFSLEGTTLYTSCEPCPMCMTAALWARVSRVVYAADRHDAASGGFDDRAFYDMLTQDRAVWNVPVEGRRIANATAPFDAWRDAGGRTDY